MTAFTTLLDGGLRVYIAGVERQDVVHGLNWESTNRGDGGGGFWAQVADPFNPQGDYPELRHGAPVIVDHTLGATTTRLYTGFVLSDPRTGYAGEKAVVQVTCGSALEVAKCRRDVGYIFTDADTSQWLANKRSPKAFGFDNSGRIEIRVDDEAKLRRDRAGMIGAVAYLGATHMLGIMNGWRRITGTASWNLKDKLDAALLWWPAYKVGLDASDYHVVHAWTANSTASNRRFDYTFGGADGAGYVALAMWPNKAGTTKTTGERFVELEDVVLYTDVAQKTVDQAMLRVAQVIGLSDGYDVATIGNVLQSLLVRPHTDQASALASLAGQADRLVEWGYFGGRFRARPMETNPITIRSLPNCYLVSSDGDGVIWDVGQHPDEGVARSLRLLYGQTGKTIWPAGTPASVIAPANPGWASGVPFMGASSPVMTVDFSAHNYAESRARSIAASLARHLGVGLSGGPVEIKSPTVPVHSGGSRPTPYIHGADWIECEQGDAGPLYITRAHVDADTGYVDLDVGLSEDLLIDQLAAAGSATAVKLHRPHRKRG